MPLQVQCGTCGKQYRVAEDAAGKTLRCKQCGNAFKAEPMATEITSKPPKTAARTVPPPVPARRAELALDEDDDRPRRRTRSGAARTRDEHEDRRPRPTSKSSYLGLFIAVGAVAAVLLMGLVGLLLWKSSGVRPQMAAVNAPPIPMDHHDPEAAPNAPPIPMAIVAAGKGEILPASVHPYPFVPPNPGPPPAKQNNPNKRAIELPAKAEGDWQADVDRAAAADDVKPPLREMPPLAGGSKLYMSAAPGLQSMLVRPGGANPVLARLDVSKLAVTPMFGVKEFDQFAFSPDAAAVAATKNNLDEVVVLSAPEGDLLHKVAVPRNASDRRLEFLAGDLLLVLYNEGLRGHIEIVDWKNKQLLTSLPLDGDSRPGAFALSPGRNFFAVGGNRKVRIYQAKTGNVVGSLALDKDRNAGIDSRGLAFTFDGSELALLYSSHGKHQIACWDVKTGDALLHHVLDKDPRHSPFYRGDNLQFLADKSGWLAYSQVYLDRTSGLIAHQYPEPTRKGHRRILNKERVLWWDEAFGATPAEVQTLPKAEIEAGVERLRQSAAETRALAKLPDPKPSDFSQTKVAAANANAAALTVEAATPLPPQVGLQNLTLPTNKAQDVIQLVFSGNKAAKAAVVHLFSSDPINPRKHLRAAQLDLVSGKTETTDLLISEEIQNRSGHRNSFFNPPGLVVPMTLDMATSALSDDGKLLALRHIDAPSRIDVWDLSTKKHLAGWLPYGDNGHPVWFGFNEQNILLTLDAGGKLIGWKVPECQALFAAENVRGVPAFSPQRKMLAVQSGINLAMCDAATGELKGTLPNFKGPVADLFAAAFSNDGQELAAVVKVGAATSLVRYHLGKKEIVAELAAEPVRAGLQWVGPNHVMFGLALVEWSFRGGALYLYGVPNDSALVSQSPDQRYWVAHGNGNNPVVLKPLTLPDPEALEFSALLVGGNSRPLVTKGEAVSVTVNTNDGRFRGDVLSTLETMIRQKGFPIARGGIMLTVGAQEVQLGRTVEFEVSKGFGPRFMPPIGPRFGPIGPRGQIIKVADRDIVCSYLVTNAAGEKLLEQKHTVKLPNNVRTNEGEDFETQVVRQMWDQATNWGRMLPLPTNMYRVGGAVHSIPRRSNLPGN